LKARVDCLILQEDVLLAHSRNIVFLATYLRSH
jgi:hypothetical protein